VKAVFDNFDEFKPPLLRPCRAQTKWLHAILRVRFKEFEP